MNDSRRRFIENILLTTSGIAVMGVSGFPTENSLASEGSQPAGNLLRMPPTYDGSGLNARVARQFIYPDRSTNVWTYGDGMPSPTIRIKKGERFTARLVNNLH